MQVLYLSRTKTPHVGCVAAESLTLEGESYSKRDSALAASHFLETKKESISFTSQFLKHKIFCLNFQVYTIKLPKILNKQHSCLNTELHGKDLF